MILTFLFIQHLTLNVIHVYLYSTKIWKITILNIFERSKLIKPFSQFDQEYWKKL